MGNYEVTRRIEWDMAHRIPLHGGKCQYLHGHRYAAEITCRASELDEMGAVVDFGLIKQLVGSWVDEHWDHNTCHQADDVWMQRLSSEARMLWEDDQNPPPPWFALQKAPTAENLAEKLYEVAQEKLADHGIKVVRIDLWETPNCRARYEPPKRPGEGYSEEDYNDIAGLPSFKDPSIAGLKEILSKEEDT